jgi:hypothetical protein
MWFCVFLLGERTWMLCDLMLIINFMKTIALVGWGCKDTHIWYIPIDPCCHTYCASPVKYNGGNYVCNNRHRVMVSRWNEGNSNFGKTVSVTVVLLTLYWLMSQPVWLALFFRMILWSDITTEVKLVQFCGVQLSVECNRINFRATIQICSVALQLNFVFAVFLLPASC